MPARAADSNVVSISSPSTRYRLLRTAVWMLSIVLLSGCFADRSEQSDEIEIGRTEAGLVIASCGDLRFDFLLMEYRVGNAPWVEFWSSEGAEVSLAKGDLLTLADAAVLELEPPASEPPLEPGTLVSVLLKGRDEVWDAIFRIPEGGLRVDSWLRSDDVVAEGACTASGVD